MPFSVTPPAFKRIEEFENFRDLCDKLKSTVYAVVRIRKDKAGGTKYATIGTGFLGGPCRLITCAHVVDDQSKVIEGDLNKHQPGDAYLFVQRDEAGKKHLVSRQFERGKDLLIYQDIDIAIFKLDEWFYL